MNWTTKTTTVMYNSCESHNHYMKLTKGAEIAQQLRLFWMMVVHVVVHGSKLWQLGHVLK